MSVQPIPEGYASVTPHLVVKNAAKAIEFYKKAFGFVVHGQHGVPGTDQIMHCQLKFGNASVMVNDEFPDWGVLGPESIGGTAVTIHLYVNDVDAVFDRAVKAGCEVMMPVQDQFWGDRWGMVKDPYGHQWGIATHKQDLSPEEITKGAEEFFKNMGDCH